MNELKQSLAQLIDTYADAKVSKNQILLSYATQELQKFIAAVDLVPAEQVQASVLTEEE